MEEDKTKNEDETRRPFADPVYNQLAKMNGSVNKMSLKELSELLGNLHLDKRGNKDVLKKRVKNYYKMQKIRSLAGNASTAKKHYDFLCVIDFEATCEQGNPPHYKHEIIEFPAVLVDVAERKIVNEFHKFCRPVINPTLTPFCTELTGITQEQVDSASLFPEVLSEFEKWLETYKLGTTYSFAITTDGPWDMGRFLYYQCKASDIEYPAYAKNWVNLRKTFSNFYECKRLNLQDTLSYLGLSFDGSPHCGLDDSRNIAKIALHLLCDGAGIKTNENLIENRSLDGPKTIASSTKKKVFYKRKTDDKVEQNGDSDDSQDVDCVTGVETV